MRRKSFILVAMVAGAVLAAANEALFFSRGVEPGAGAREFASLVLLILAVLWVDADSRQQPRIYRPFEFGYLVWLFWLPYLPYYFWRTRGPLGLVQCAGLVGLVVAGYVVGWALHAAN